MSLLSQDEVFEQRLNSGPLGESSSLRDQLSLYIVLIFSITLFFACNPLPHVFTGVDTTVTGIEPKTSRVYLFQELLAIGWLPLLFARSAQRTIFVKQLALASWPLLAFAGAAMASMAWTVDGYETQKQTITLIFLFLFIFAIHVQCTQNQALRILNISLSAILLLSILMVLIVPSMAVHHATDALQSVHDGKWRGAFEHKNLLGQVASMEIILVVTSYKKIFASPAMAFGCLAMAGLVLLKTQSASSWFSAFAGVFTYCLFCMKPLWRNATIALLSLVLIANWSLGIDIIGALSDLVGRDATLTGRTKVWAFALDNMKGFWWGGRGFGNAAQLRDLLLSNFGDSFVDVHSGYINLLLALGLIGLSALALIVVNALMAFRTVPPAAQKNYFVNLAFIAAWLSAAVTEISPMATFNVIFLCAMFMLVGLYKTKLIYSDRA